MSKEAWGVVGAIILSLWVVGSFIFIEMRNAPTCDCDDSDNCTCGGASGQRKAPQMYLPQWPWFG